MTIFVRAVVAGIAVLTHVPSAPAQSLIQRAMADCTALEQQYRARFQGINAQLQACQRGSQARTQVVTGTCIGRRTVAYSRCVYLEEQQCRVERERVQASARCRRQLQQQQEAIRKDAERRAQQGQDGIDVATSAADRLNKVRDRGNNLASRLSSRITDHAISQVEAGARAASGMLRQAAEGAGGGSSRPIPTSRELSLPPAYEKWRVTAERVAEQNYSTALGERFASDPHMKAITPRLAAMAARGEVDFRDGTSLASIARALSQASGDAETVGVRSTGGFPTEAQLAAMRETLERLEAADAAARAAAARQKAKAAPAKLQAKRPKPTPIEQEEKPSAFMSSAEIYDEIFQVKWHIDGTYSRLQIYQNICETCDYQRPPFSASIQTLISHAEFVVHSSGNWRFVGDSLCIDWNYGKNYGQEHCLRFTRVQRGSHYKLDDGSQLFKRRVPIPR